MSFKKSKFPQSITIPPILGPFPQINFVKEWVIILAPQFAGLWRKGVAKVLSTTRGIWFFSAIFPTASISTIEPSGFDNVSIKINFVLSFISFSKFFTLSGSTKEQSQPKFLNVLLNWLIDPPYNLFEAMKWSLLPSRDVKANCWDAWPEEQATAALLFSKFS